MIRVKICGLRDEGLIDLAADAGADWIGLVVAPASPRYTPPERAGALARHAMARGLVPWLVAQLDLAAAAPPPELAAALEAAPAATGVQLHPIGEARRTVDRARFGARPLIRAVPVAASADLAGLDAGGADHLLLDAKAPLGAAYAGGHGRAFDWSILAGWAPPGPWILAGGLAPDTVAEAVAVTGAPAVDVSSGVESAPGVKDPARVRAFVAAAKAAAPSPRGESAR